MGTPLEIELLDTAPDGWDESLLGAGGVVFHSTGWAAYKQVESGGDAVFCEWRPAGGGEVLGRALAMRRPGRSSAASRLGFRLVFDSPPATEAEGLDFVAPLREWAGRNRAALEVELGTYDARSQWLPGTPPNPRPRMDFVMPPGDVEAIWAEMRKLARRKVKAATKEGFACRRATEIKPIRAFADVYAVTETRLQDQKGVDLGPGIDPAGFAAGLAALEENGVGGLYVAEREGKVEAGAVFATFGDRAYLIHSGAGDEGRRRGAPYLVLYEALRDLRERGHGELSLGGAGGDAEDPDSSEHGLYQFKTRFGAAVEPHTSGSLRPHPGRARLVGIVRKVVRR